MLTRRPLEAGLLLCPLLLLGLALVQLDLVQAGRIGRSQLGGAALFGVVLLGLHLMLAGRARRSDQLLLPLASMLAALGMVTETRLEPTLALRQGLWLAIGGLLLSLTVWHLPYVDWLKRYRYSAALLGIVLVLSTFALGVDPNGSGARLWLGAGGVYFQPVEALKLLLVVFFAAYLDDYRELLAHAGRRVGPWQLPPLPYLLPLLAMLSLALALLAWQRDLGAALLVFGVFLALLYAASGRPGVVALGLLGFALAAYLAYFAFAVIQLRVAVWLDPWAQREGAGYQVIQALYAFAAGGVAGSGLGYGAPELIPAAHTDFAVAALAEELGLSGSLAVVTLYALFVYRSFRVALDTPNSFAALLAAGLGSTMGLQALIILGGTLRLIPLTGITLPLISYGGSSVVANFVSLGLLLRVSDEAERVRDAR